MKLLFKNEFAWDGLYWIEDEANVEKYYIDARLSENSRNIYVFDPEHKEVGAIRQKALALKKEYSIYYSNIKEGSVNRILPLYDYDYLVSYKDWMVSGDVYSWNFRIVYPRGDIATSITENGFLGLEIQEEKFEKQCDLLMMAIAGLQDDLKKEAEARARGESTSIGANLLKAGKNAFVKAGTAMDEHFEKNREEAAKQEAAEKAKAEGEAAEAEAEVEEAEEIK